MVFLHVHLIQYEFDAEGVWVGLLVQIHKSMWIHFSENWTLTSKTVQTEPPGGKVLIDVPLFTESPDKRKQNYCMQSTIWTLGTKIHTQSVT